MELSRNDSKMLQGLSVLAMVWLHLFDRGYAGLFSPALFFQGTALSFYIAQLCDFCVFGFAFCSGYGHMVQYQLQGCLAYKKRLKGLLGVFTDYWVILFLFTLISLCFANPVVLKGGAKTFLLSVLGLDNSYNGAWWYLYAYGVIVLISPYLLKAIKHFHPLVVLFFAGVVYCTAYYLRFFQVPANFWLAKLGPLGMTIAEYIIGAECCHLKVISRLYTYWQKMQCKLRLVLSVILLCAMLYGHTKLVPSLFIAPITGSAVMLVFHYAEKPAWVKKAFRFLGLHATNIWLTHMFFFTGELKNYAYKAEYPLLIFVIVLGVTIALSYVLKLLQNPIRRLIDKI